jgi:hypothetical protein
MIRLYFNRRGQRPWSIDSGAGTEERSFKRVDVETTGKTKFDPRNVGSEDFPCAWLEFENAMAMYTPASENASIWPKL